MAAVTIIGIGDNGCVGMSAKAYNCIQKAQEWFEEKGTWIFSLTSKVKSSPSNKAL